VYEIYVTSTEVCARFIFISVFIPTCCIYLHNSDTTYSGFRGRYSLLQDMRQAATFLCVFYDLVSRYHNI
jgi:hypothetical protein